METIKNIINQFKDPQLLIIIGCLIVVLILFRIFSNFLARHKIMKVAIIGLMLVCLILGIFWFVDHRTDFYSNNATNYVYGEVRNISSAVRKIEINVTRTNVKNKDGRSISDKTVVVDADVNCKFLDKNGKEISFNDIGFYDTVQIYVKEKKISDVSKENLSGVKVVVKSDVSK